MQLLDSSQQRSLDTISESLQVCLDDIVNHLKIDSDFSISHPDYKALETPAQAVELFQKLPSDLQNKYLTQQLRGFLYGVYYNGSLQSALSNDKETKDLELHKNLENNTFLGVDTAFYEKLHENNQGRGYFDSGWEVLRQEEDGSLAVRKGGLTLHLPRNAEAKDNIFYRHLAPDSQSPQIGDKVAILLPKNRVQNGFYMAIGDAGPNARHFADKLSQIVRIYFNLSSEGAVAVMNSLTKKLNDLAIPFQFKALYNPSEYKRHDSAVLYFEKSNYETIHKVIQSVYTEHQAHFRDDVPLFTKVLAPGLSLAEEPNQKFTELESFGMNRCQIIAHGLLEAREKGDESPESRMREILQYFSKLGIAIERSYVNADSEDIYTTLNL
jgi:hypothetical protein